MRYLLLTFAIALPAAIGFFAPRAVAGEPLRVMTFNIRYATAPDGNDAWEKRRDFMADVIRQFNPDLLGTQEVLATQVDFLKEKFSDYTLVGVGRDDGQRKGEFSAAMYKEARFDPLDSGTFWLSETPDKPGSKSWDSSLPRIVTWTKLRDNENGGREICFLNTHWDHRGNQARVEAGKIIRKWLAENAKGLPVIMTGDLNVHDDHVGFKSLMDSSARGPKLIDAYRVVHPQVEPDEATAHGFKGGVRGRRIDFILHTPEFKTLEARIDHANRDGHYPSDHYPVTAVLRLEP